MKRAIPIKIAAVIGAVLIVCGIVAERRVRERVGRSIVPSRLHEREPLNRGGVRGDLADWVLHEGYRSVRAGDVRAAQEAAWIASVLDPTVDVAALERRIERMQVGRIQELRAQADEARAAGDVRRVERFKGILSEETP